MAPITSILLLLLVLYASRTIWASRVRRQNRHAEAARRGCKPPPTLRSNNLLGTQILKESIKATEEDRGPQYIIEAMNRLGANVNTCRVPILDYELIVTRDPRNAKALFATQSADFDISPNRSKSWWPLLGHGIFTSRGEAWKHSRALVNPQFSRQQVSDLSLEEKHVQLLLKRLHTRNTDGWTDGIDLQPLFFSFTLDTATEFLFGTSANSLDPSSSVMDEHGICNGVEFGKHLDAAKMWIDKRGALAKFYWLLNSKDFKGNCVAIHAYIDRQVASVLKTTDPTYDFEKTADDRSKRKFVLLKELAKQTRDPLELRNETLHILTAGRDPSGALLSWVFYFLARSPLIYTKLRSIVLCQFGPSSSEILLPDLKSCAYLQYVISEALRVAAVIPMNERVAVRDTTIPYGGGELGEDPIFVPKGGQVLIPKYAMQHRPDIWGDDVEEFKPERWEGRKAGWEFVPFGGGARKCLGQQFALIEIAYVVVRLMQKFDALQNLEAPGPIKLHHAIETRSGTGVQVRFHEASL